jgi:hypothetical protein
MVTTYTQFIGMKPPTFTKAEEPLEVDAWVRAIEAKFSAFTLPCSEERKANFATLQHWGEALMWWEHFKSMQPTGHEVTWVEFKQAFKDHHIPKGLMDRKMRELLALKQGANTVYQYAQKFNCLCQYGGHHVDTNAKKMESFHDGLDGDLYERLTLLEPNSYHELVNKAISQEDAMKKAQKDRKRQADFTPDNDSCKQLHFVKKHTHGSSQSSPSGQWRMTSFQNKPSVNFQYQKNQQQVSKPKELSPAFATIVDSLGIMQMSARTPGSRSPNSRTRTPDLLKATTARSQAFK